MNLTFKKQVFEACFELIDHKVKTIKSAISSTIESRDNETKSSAGDKFETGRAMMQNEQNRLENQLANASQLRAELKQINPDKRSDTVGKGALVKTNKGIYFVTVGLGKISVEGKKVFAISQESPLGNALFGRSEGESILINGQTHIIDSLI